MLLRKLKVDDVVDAFPVHGACGAWGVLALGLFGNEDEGIGGNGLFYGGDQLRTQVMGVIVIAAWAGVLSFAVMAPLRKCGLLRLSDQFQSEGADLMEHSPARASKFSPWDDVKSPPANGTSAEAAEPTQKQDSPSKPENNVVNETTKDVERSV